jgi:hypothetical protein
LSFSQKASLHHLNGKIKSYQLFEVLVDTPVQKLKLVESISYDNHGNLILSTFYLRNSSTQTEKRIYRGDTTIIFRCSCKNLDLFINDFKIRDKKELQNLSQRFTHVQPTKFVTYNIFDKRRNLISKKEYSENGILKNETIFMYNTMNKVVRKIHFDGDGVITQKISYRYNKSGNILEVNDSLLHSLSIKTPLVEKIIFDYDQSDVVIKETHYRDTILYSNYEYYNEKDKNIQKFIKLDKLTNTSYIDSIIHYNPNNQILKKIKQLGGIIYQIIEYDYYDTGFLKSETHYDKDYNIVVKTFFNNDKNNNPFKLQEYYLQVTSNSIGVVSKTERKKNEYQIKIQYY